MNPSLDKVSSIVHINKVFLVSKSSLLLPNNRIFVIDESPRSGKFPLI